MVLRDLAHMEEALEHSKLATELDPFSPRIWTNYGTGLSQAGRPAEGIIALDRALSLQPNFGPALRVKCYALVELGRFPEAIALVKMMPSENAGTAATNFLSLPGRV